LEHHIYTSVVCYLYTKMTWSTHMNVCVFKKEGAVNRGWRDPPL